MAFISQEGSALFGFVFIDGRPAEYAPQSGINGRSPLRISAYDPDGRTYYDPPQGLNYETGLTRRLFKATTILKGEVQAVDYYQGGPGTDPQNPEDPVGLVVSESHAYTRDATGLAQSRTITITWRHEDGTPHPTTKALEKDYTPRESIREGKTRRSNIIDRVEMLVAGSLVATETTLPETDPGYPAEAQTALDLGRDFLKSARDAIADYKHGAIPDILTEVANYNVASIVNAPAPWMDNMIDGNGTTIRQLITTEMDLWS